MKEGKKMSSPVEQQNAPPSENAPGNALARLRFVLLIVLILCGGNALGILLGVICWTKTGSKAAGILIVVALTLAAFLIVMFLALRKLRRTKSSGR